jgi:hypothetical protein
MTDITMVTVDGIDIDVVVSQGGLYCGTSKQVPGLRVIEARLEDIPRAAREAIANMQGRP